MYRTFGVLQPVLRRTAANAAAGKSALRAVGASRSWFRVGLGFQPRACGFASAAAERSSSEQTSTPRASSLGGFADLAQTKVKHKVFDDDGNMLRVSISESAADKLNLIMTEDKNPDLMLRILVESGGCHGFQYIFGLKNRKEITEDDGVFERNGACVVIDATSLEVLRDATIDYVTELIGSQFKVTSPYTDSTCGCGSSFSFDPSKIPQEKSDE